MLAKEMRGTVPANAHSKPLDRGATVNNDVRSPGADSLTPPTLPTKEDPRDSHAIPRESVVEGLVPDPGSSLLDVEEGAAGYVDAATVAVRIAAEKIASNPARGRLDLAPVTAKSFRAAMGCMATGVCVVTTVSDGRDLAMTANSVTSLSLEPPLLLVCIAVESRFHEAIVQSGRWGVSILDATSHELSSQLARPGRDGEGQLARVSYDRGPTTDVALLTAAVARFECTTSVIHPGGDHSIVVGSVVALSNAGPGINPLLFHRGRYRWLL